MVYNWNVAKSWVQILCYIGDNVLAAGDASGGVYLMDYSNGSVIKEW
jgi:hypothetical protein